MLSKEILLTLYAYNDWANQRIFDAAVKVAQSDLGVSAVEGQRSLQELLFHTVRTEWLWRNLIQHQSRPDNPPRPEDMPDLPAIRAFSQSESQQMKALLAQLDEAALGSTIQVVAGSGQASPLVVWHMLMQPILHGNQHRSEASLILTNLGQSPGDIDFIFFV